MNIAHLLIPEIKEHIKRGELAPIKTLLSELHPAEISDIIENLNTHEAILVLRLLDSKKMADVLSLFEGPNIDKILKGFSDEQIANIIQQMDPDDRTCLFEELPPETVRRILSLLPYEKRRVALQILNYPENSSGRFISTDFAWCYHTDKVSQVLNKLKLMDISDELMLNIYVLDEKQKLKGYVKLPRLIKADENVSIINIIEPTPSVSVYEPVEVAAKIIADYDLYAIPVVDKDNRLVGIITIDDIVDVISEEAEEDIQKLMAIEPVEDRYFMIDTFSRVRKRVVWLVLLLVMENFAAQILHSYEEQLKKFTILATFIPMLMAAGGNVGSQSATLTVRAMATGEINLGFKEILTVILKEGLAIIIMAFILGLVGVLNALFRGTNAFIALSLGLSLFVIVVVSNYLGMFLPFIARKLFNIDPATISSPLIATISDATSLFIYFTISSLLIRN